MKPTRWKNSRLPGRNPSAPLEEKTESATDPNAHESHYNPAKPSTFGQPVHHRRAGSNAQGHGNPRTDDHEKRRLRSEIAKLKQQNKSLNSRIATLQRHARGLHQAHQEEILEEEETIEGYREMIEDLRDRNYELLKRVLEHEGTHADVVHDLMKAGIDIAPMLVAFEFTDLLPSD
ncbi:hypothetical protein ABW19_dt0207588 [Dactylella cylindrospora]|nr:hypothetical protein ABW19_dt0207588 [Dactylella cylindrospora]